MVRMRVIAREIKIEKEGNRKGPIYIRIPTSTSAALGRREVHLYGRGLHAVVDGLQIGRVDVSVHVRARQVPHEGLLAHLALAALAHVGPMQVAVEHDDGVGPVG